MKVRTYGAGPYQAAVLHGGPGAPGSAGGLARRLGETVSVMEPFQSGYCIFDLLCELKQQIEAYGAPPVTLIGHSWGAWLAAFFAAEHRALVQKVILVGAGPLKEEYVSQIGMRRKANLSPEEGVKWDRLCRLLENGLGTQRELGELGALADRADSYAPIAHPPEETPPPDEKMYAQIWREAAESRRCGALLQAFSRIACPIVIIQGKQDPHPPAGILEPLREIGVSVKSYLLDRCGHTPWEETYAQKRFFEILSAELRKREAEGFSFSF